jgi:hypothetical protein
MWFAVLGAEAGMLQIVRSGWRGTNVGSSRVWKAPNRDAADSKSEDLDSTLWQDTAVTQRLNYHRTESGRTSVDGWLRIGFVRDQRTAIAHVAFCPAFAHQPTVEAEPLDGPPCDVRSALVLPWGVRWEVRLDAPATEPTELVLGFLATGGERPAISD